MMMVWPVVQPEKSYVYEPKELKLLPGILNTSGLAPVQ